MKKLIVLFCLLASSAIYGQAPKLLNYQGVARDASGNIVTSLIGIKFEILQGSTVGTVVFSETNTTMPSAAGIFTTHIGSGTPVTGNFSAINWSGGPYFIRVSIDPSGGSLYSVVGTSQLVSVPYALYAETAGNAQTFTAGNGITINSGTITNSSPNQTVNISGSAVTGSYPNYTISTPGAPTASTGISITGGTITNTAPDQTVTLVPAGISSITGAYPTFTIDVPPPSLNYNTGTNVLTLTQGTAVATTTLLGAGSNTVAMFSSGIASVTPVGAGSNFTVSVPPPNFTNVGASSLTGTYPNYTLTSPGAATLTPPTLQINPPHTTTTLSPNNFSINIQPTSITGPGVLGSYPNYTITSPAATSLTGVGVASVSGASPSFTVSVPSPTISSSGNTITISQGTAVATATFAGGPWTSSLGVIYPASNPTNDKVAIGHNTSGGSYLDILNPAASTVTASPVAYMNNANASFGGNGVLEIKNSAGGGAGIYVSQNNNLGDGITVNTNGITNGGNAVQSTHFGIGNAGFFTVNNSSSNGKAIDASTNGVGNVISAVISNSLNSSAALYVNTNGTGAAGSFNKTTAGYGIYSQHSGTSGHAGFFNITNSSNGSPAITGQTNGSGDAVSAYNTGNGRAFYATSTSSNEAAFITNAGTGRALYASTTNNSEAAYLSNTGNGMVLYGINTGSVDAAQFVNTGTARALIANNNSSFETGFFNNSGSGRGLVVVNSSGSPNRAGLINGGLDVMGKTTASTAFAVVVTNSASTNLFNVRDDGNVGINVSNPGYRLSVNESGASLAAIYGTQSSAAGSSGAHGVFGLTSNTNTFAAGVHGESSGSGPAVSGSKTSGTGPAGRFEITTTTNTADGLFTTTNGGGAALHAVNGPTVSGGSNAAVWLESGHLKSTQIAPPTTNTISASGGGITSATVSLSAGSTDVKGTLLAVITTTGIINQNNNFVVRVNFNKPYLNPPVVVLTPASDNGVLHPFVSGISATSFTVTFKNPTTTNMSAGATFSVNYNYMVIE